MNKQTRVGSVTHGMSRSGTYRSWDNMIARCTRPSNPAYHRYGGSGVTVCDRWLHSFAAFLADMGERPSLDLTLDRIDNEGNYEPGNCRWATRSQQQFNRRKAIKTCPVCGVRFNKHGKRSKYCGRECYFTKLRTRPK